MFGFKPLMAVDWIEIVIFLIIVISSLIGQLFKGNKPKPKQKPARPRPQPRPPQERAPEMGRDVGRMVGDAGRGRAQADAGKSALEKEIEEFLQRHRQGQPAGRAPATPPATTTRRPPTPPRRKPTPSGLPTAPKSRPAPVETFPKRERAESRLESTIRPTSTVSREPVLGEQLDQADERLELRLQDVFQHGLGQLDSGANVQPAIAAGTDSPVWEGRRPEHPMYEQLLEMLSSPQRIQTAMVLSEILRRPEERWS